ncbi:MAG: hypothetical protein AAF483_19615 [Planctomycetota bacterium]
MSPIDEQPKKKPAKGREEARSILVTLLAALFIGTCSYIFIAHFSANVLLVEESPIDEVSSRLRSDVESKMAYTNRIRKQALKDEAALQNRLAAKREVFVSTTETPDDYMEAKSQQLEASIRQIGKEHGLARGMLQDLENLNSGNH